MDFNSPADIATSSLRGMSQSPTSSNSSEYDRMFENGFHVGDHEDEEDFESDLNTITSQNNRRHLYPAREQVEELRPEEIRWFYKSGNDKWISFIGYDSLRIECRHRALCLSNENGDIDEDEKILVRGGLYEVDVKLKKCLPVYWSEDESTIIRGLWFEEGSWQPLDEGFAERIEEEHMAHFKGMKIEAATDLVKGLKPVLHHIQFKDFHVDWNATDEVYKFNESTSSKIFRNVRQSLGWQKSGTRLLRSYGMEAVMDDKPPDVCHLVFVIHGIAQKMDYSHIVRVTKDLRDRVKYMRTKMFPEFDTQCQRTEFLPVQWRSLLKLDQGTVESVTPHKMKNVRALLNSSALDILYYTSPLFRFEITTALRTEMSRLYQMFCARHPYFEASKGKVSIVAHSLGSVISYDIITGWNPVNLYDQLMTSLLKNEEETADGNEDVLKDVKIAQDKVADLESLMGSIRARQSKKRELPFAVENLFSIGSPLAVFLALRGVRPQGVGNQNHILSTKLCNRLFNIFHPSDPVAYRLEPLILKHYATIMPLPIHHFSAPKKEPYSKIPRKAYAAFTASLDEITQSKNNNEIKKDSDSGEGESSGREDGEGAGNAIQQKFSLSSWFKKKKTPDSEENLSAELHKMSQGDGDRGASPDNNYADDKDDDGTELDYRLDFQLKEQRMENSYVSVLTSHTSYWTNKDVAYFLLIHLHPELQEEEQLT